MTDYTVLQKTDRKFINVTCPKCRRTYSSGQLYLIGPKLGCPNCHLTMTPMEWLGFKEGEE